MFLKKIIFAAVAALALPFSFAIADDHVVRIGASIF